MLTQPRLVLRTQLPCHDLYQNKIHPQKRSQCDTSEKSKPLTALFPHMQLEALCAANKVFKLLPNLRRATNYFGNYSHIVTTPLNTVHAPCIYICMSYKDVLMDSWRCVSIRNINIVVLERAN